MEVRGEAQVRCGKCGAIVYIPGDYLIMEQTWGDERGMGEELGYEGFCETNCANCGNDIFVRYEVTEYPVGFINSAEADIKGGKLIETFGGVEIADIDDIYSLYTDVPQIILPTGSRKSRIILPEEKKIITRLESCVDLLIEDIIKKPELVREIAPRKFEELIAHIFKRAGFNVDLTKQTRDGGYDMIAIRDDALGIRSKYIIECKRYAKTNQVTVELVRHLYAIHTTTGANKSILATTSTFTRDAKKFALETKNTQWAMDLKDYDDVIEWVKNSKA